MIGQRFGHLVAVGSAHSDRPGLHFLFACDCGNTEVRPARDVRASVKRGHAPACMACVRSVRAANGKANRVHGFTVDQKRLYDVHRQMMRRCYDAASKDFDCYGGRGITVCDEWHDRGVFIAWAQSSGYLPGLTIERFDVNAGYSPDNCTWIVNERQAHNTSKVIRITANGRTMPASEWSAETGISERTIKTRLRLGWSHQQAVTVPPARGRNQYGGAPA